MNRRDLLKGIGLGAAATAMPRAAVSAGKSKPLDKARARPNFIIILVDDMGWTDLTCFGSRYFQTPNIDRLASEGMKFTDAYAACAVCSPTRAAVMTGRYPARTGITDWIRFREVAGRASPLARSKYVGSPRNKLLCPPNPYWMDLDEVTIAELLKPAGYTSCHIGKWHLGPARWYPNHQGFDRNVGGCEFGQPPSYFDPYSRGRGDKVMAGIPTLRPRKQGEYLTDREGDEAVRFITEHAGKPFFLYMSHYAVHTPIQAKEDLVARYKARKPTNQKNPTYAAMIHSVDEAVGRIMDALDKLKLTDKTVVIFTSDNGGLMGPTDNAPLRAGKGHPYEGGIRVPLIVRWPGLVKPGSVCRSPVTSVDYFPTICAAAGVNPPGRRKIDGEDLLPVLEQTGRLKRDAIYWHFPHCRGGIVPYSIIRAGDWKLIKRYQDKRFELFNLSKDISEATDLASRVPEKVKALDAMLTAFLAGARAKLPRRNPNYDPSTKPAKKRRSKPGKSQ